MVLKPGREAEAEAIFQQMGARLRGDRRGHRHRPHGARVRTARSWPTSRSARSPTRRRSTTGRTSSPEYKAWAGEAARRRARKHRHRRGPAEADGLARPRQPPLDLGAVRPAGRRRHGPAPGRRRRGGARPRHRRRRWRSPPTARRAIATPTRTRAASRRSPRPTATSARSARSRSAITNCLNFGNPQRPEIMGQFVGCLEGMGEACRALDFPIVSGNVSPLQRDQERRTAAARSCRRPRSAASACSRTGRRAATIGFKAEGETILLIGHSHADHLGQSLWLRELPRPPRRATPPPVDLAAERRHGELVRELIAAGLVTAVHDVSDGGVARRARRNGAGRRRLARA